MWTSALNKQGPYMRISGRDASAIQSQRRRPFSLDYSSSPVVQSLQHADVDSATGSSSVIADMAPRTRRSSAGAEENSFVLRNRAPETIPPPPESSRRRAHTAEPRRPDKVFGERLSSRLAQRARAQRNVPQQQTPPAVRNSVDEDRSQQDLTRSDSFMAKARRALTGPAILRHAYVDRDVSGRNSPVAPASRPIREQSRRTWTNNARAHELRVKELENELAALKCDGTRMADRVVELEEENAQIKSAVPILEDVLRRARQMFETKERALKQMITKLDSELSTAIQEKNDLLNILNQYTRGRKSRSHSSSFGGPRSLGSYQLGHYRSSYVSSSERGSFEALAGESNAARRIEELEKLSGPLLPIRDRQDDRRM